MNVEVIVRVDGREVGILRQQISGQPVDIEQQVEAIKDRVGRPSESWTNFLERHAGTLWACDFFSVKTVTAREIAVCAEGKRVRFFRVTEIITQLMEAREDRDLLRLRKQLSKLALLILVELGYVPASKVGSELLFDVISSASERQSLIVRTNLSFENWTEVLSSESLAHHAVFGAPESSTEKRKLL